MVTKVIIQKKKKYTKYTEINFKHISHYHHIVTLLSFICFINIKQKTKLVYVLIVYSSFFLVVIVFK